MLKSTLVSAIFHHGIERSTGTGEVENSSESMCYPVPQWAICGRLRQ
jgi:hypothetical protein